MAKVWKKLQRSDSDYTGDVTGTIDGTAAATVKGGAAKANLGLTALGVVDLATPIAKGGTGETTSTPFLNSKITTKADGTLNYDGTTAVTPDIASIGGTLTVAKGGTGVTANTSWLNSKITTKADGGLNYDGTSAVAPSLASIGGTTPVASGGTGVTANTSWLNSKITTKADGTLNYDGTGAVAPSLASLTGTTPVASGGTGVTANTSWLNAKVTTSADGTLNYDGTTAVAPSLPSIAGTLTLAKGGTGATSAAGAKTALSLEKVVNQKISINSTSKSLEIDDTAQDLNATLLGGDASSTIKAAAVTTAEGNIIGSAPGTLNTLDKIAEALLDDPTYITSTIVDSIATKGKAPMAITANDAANSSYDNDPASEAEGQIGILSGQQYVVVNV